MALAEKGLQPIVVGGIHPTVNNRHRHAFHGHYLDGLDFQPALQDAQIGVSGHRSGFLHFPTGQLRLDTSLQGGNEFGDHL